MPAGATGARGLALGNRLVLQSLRIQRNQDSDSDFETLLDTLGLFRILCISC